MEDNQNARFVLRKRFLLAIAAQRGKPVQLNMKEAPRAMDGVFKGCDSDFSKLLISNLETRIGQEPNVVLRVSDVNALKFD